MDRREPTIDSITFTVSEAEDLVAVLRWGIGEGVGYGHALPDDPEFQAAERQRKGVLDKVERMLRQARLRARAQARLRRFRHS